MYRNTKKYITFKHNIHFYNFNNLIIKSTIIHHGSILCNWIAPYWATIDKIMWKKTRNQYLSLLKMGIIVAIMQFFLILLFSGFVGSAPLWSKHHPVHNRRCGSVFGVFGVACEIRKQPPPPPCWMRIELDDVLNIIEIVQGFAMISLDQW